MILMNPFIIVAVLAVIVLLILGWAGVLTGPKETTTAVAATTEGGTEGGETTGGDGTATGEEGEPAGGDPIGLTDESGEQLAPDCCLHDLDNPKCADFDKKNCDGETTRFCETSYETEAEREQCKSAYKLNEEGKRTPVFSHLMSENGKYMASPQNKERPEHIIKWDKLDQKGQLWSLRGKKLCNKHGACMAFKDDGHLAASNSPADWAFTDGKLCYDGDDTNCISDSRGNMMRAAKEDANVWTFENMFATKTI